MNVVIIGCGYVGKAVARAWKHQGLTVTATTTTPTRLAELESIAHQTIILKGNDEATLSRVLANQQVVLLSVGAPNKDAYEETYLQTAKTIAKVLPHCPTVEQVIYTGSYVVYGDRQGDWVTENTPIQPESPNATILAETEQVLLGASHPSLKVCVFRLGGIYGPDREVVKIFRRAAGTTRPGDGKDASNWVHLDDIVGAIDFARVHQLQGIYNLVQTVPLTTGELLERVCTQHNLAPIQWDGTQASQRPYNAKVSNQKLQATGYQILHPEIEI